MGPSTGYQNRAILFFSHPSCFPACWKACKGCSHRTSASPQGEEGAGSAYAVTGKQTVQPIIKLPGQLTKRPAHATLQCLTFGDSPGHLLPIFLPFYKYAFKQQVIINTELFSHRTGPSSSSENLKGFPFKKYRYILINVLLIIN